MGSTPDKFFQDQINAMNTVQRLIQDVATARRAYLEEIAGITETQAGWKPGPEVWNILEITEHLFWAEQGGIFGMWKTLHAIRDGAVLRTYESIHKNMPIEQVIEITWQPKEKVPAVAAPPAWGPDSLLEDILTQPSGYTGIVWPGFARRGIKMAGAPTSYFRAIGFSAAN